MIPVKPIRNVLDLDLFCNAYGDGDDGEDDDDGGFMGDVRSQS